MTLKVGVTAHLSFFVKEIFMMNKLEELKAKAKEVNWKEVGKKTAFFVVPTVALAAVTYLGLDYTDKIVGEVHD